MGHDPAYGERLLFAEHEQHQLSRRHSAAALLQSEGRRCRELWRHFGGGGVSVGWSTPYCPQKSTNITFPAGILPPPFYNPKAGDAVNYGGFGAVIGHELTHGFDDEGRKYDGEGNLRDWWTAEDAKAFEARADCIVKEYNGFSPVADAHVNGKLTLGENAADNGGIRLAYLALMDSLAN